MHPISLYINFALHAVLGRMAEADQLMRIAGDDVRTVANALAERHPIEPRPIYRGVMLDPSKPYQMNDRLTFMSWSEDRDVAAWFASPKSFISAPLAQHDPALRSYMMKLSAPSFVLFHHSWVAAFGGLASFAALAQVHPLMRREGERQIAWSLAVQHEVITEPIDVTPIPVDDLTSDALKALDTRLSPPWLTRKEADIQL